MKLVVIMTLAAAVGGGAALAQSEQREGNPAVKSPQPNSDQSSSQGAAGGDAGSARWSQAPIASPNPKHVQKWNRPAIKTSPT
jgi:hypothetical protein